MSALPIAVSVGARGAAAPAVGAADASGSFSVEATSGTMRLGSEVSAEETEAAIRIQAGYRGWFGRERAKEIHLEIASASFIQRFLRNASRSSSSFIFRKASTAGKPEVVTAAPAREAPVARVPEEAEGPPEHSIDLWLGALGDNERAQLLRHLWRKSSNVENLMHQYQRGSFCLAENVTEPARQTSAADECDPPTAAKRVPATAPTAPTTHMANGPARSAAVRARSASAARTKPPPLPAAQPPAPACRQPMPSPLCSGRTVFGLSEQTRAPILRGLEKPLEPLELPVQDASPASPVHSDAPERSLQTTPSGEEDGDSFRISFLSPDSFNQARSLNPDDELPLSEVWVPLQAHQSDVSVTLELRALLVLALTYIGCSIGPAIAALTRGGDSNVETDALNALAVWSLIAVVLLVCGLFDTLYRFLSTLQTAALVLWAAIFISLPSLPPLDSLLPSWAEPVADDVRGGGLCWLALAALLAMLLVLYGLARLFSVTATNREETLLASGRVYSSQVGGAAKSARSPRVIVLLCKVLAFIDFHGALLSLLEAATPLLWPDLQPALDDKENPSTLEAGCVLGVCLLLCYFPLLVLLSEAVRKRLLHRMRCCSRANAVPRALLVLIEAVLVLSLGLRAALLGLLPITYRLCVAFVAHTASTLALLLGVGNFASAPTAEMEEFARAMENGAFYPVPERMQEALRVKHKESLEQMLRGCNARAVGVRVLPHKAKRRSIKAALQRRPATARLYRRARRLLHLNEVPSFARPSAAMDASVIRSSVEMDISYHGSLALQAATADDNCAPGTVTKESNAPTPRGTPTPPSLSFGRAESSTAINLGMRVNAKLTTDLSALRFTPLVRQLGLKQVELLQLRIDQIQSVERFHMTGIKIITASNGMGPRDAAREKDTYLYFETEKQATHWLVGIRALVTAPTAVLPKKDEKWLSALFRASCSWRAGGLAVPVELNVLLRRLNLQSQAFRACYHSPLPPHISFQLCCHLYQSCLSSSLFESLMQRMQADAQQRVRSRSLPGQQQRFSSNGASETVRLNKANFLRFLKGVHEPGPADALDVRLFRPSQPPSPSVSPNPRWPLSPLSKGKGSFSKLSPSKASFVSPRLSPPVNYSRLSQQLRRDMSEEPAPLPRAACIFNCAQARVTSSGSFGALGEDNEHEHAHPHGHAHPGSSRLREMVGLRSTSPESPGKGPGTTMCTRLGTSAAQGSNMSTSAAAPSASPRFSPRYSVRLVSPRFSPAMHSLHLARRQSELHGEKGTERAATTRCGSTRLSTTANSGSAKDVFSRAAAGNARPSSGRKSGDEEGKYVKVPEGKRRFSGEPAEGNKGSNRGSNRGSLRGSTREEATPQRHSLGACVGVWRGDKCEGREMGTITESAVRILWSPSTRAGSSGHVSRSASAAELRGEGQKGSSPVLGTRGSKPTLSRLMDVLGADGATSSTRLAPDRRRRNAKSAESEPPVIETEQLLDRRRSRRYGEQLTMRGLEHYWMQRGGASTLDVDGLAAIMQDPQYNPAIHPRERAIWHDMTRPLKDYLIFSSHNTYLTGNQVMGQSLAAMYKRALLQGCRCLELDCWDGGLRDGSDPIITHGLAGCTSIKAKDAIVTIRDSYRDLPAIVQTPLILSLEMHCSLSQQEKLARIFVEEFGDLLERPDNGVLKSPADLMGKIVLKGKVHAETHPAFQMSDQLVESKSFGLGSRSFGHPGALQTSLSPEETSKSCSVGIRRSTDEVASMMDALQNEELRKARSFGAKLSPPSSVVVSARISPPDSLEMATTPSKARRPSAGEPMSASKSFGLRRSFGLALGWRVSTSESSPAMQKPVSEQLSPQNSDLRANSASNLNVPKTLFSSRKETDEESSSSMSVRTTVPEMHRPTPAAAKRNTLVSFFVGKGGDDSERRHSGQLLPLSIHALPMRVSVDPTHTCLPPEILPGVSYFVELRGSDGARPQLWLHSPLSASPRGSPMNRRVRVQSRNGTPTLTSPEAGPADRSRWPPAQSTLPPPMLAPPPPHVPSLKNDSSSFSSVGALEPSCPSPPSASTISMPDQLPPTVPRTTLLRFTNGLRRTLSRDNSEPAPQRQRNFTIDMATRIEADAIHRLDLSASVHADENATYFSVVFLSDASNGCVLTQSLSAAQPNASSNGSGRGASVGDTESGEQAYCLTLRAESSEESAAWVERINREVWRWNHQGDSMRKVHPSLSSIIYLASRKHSSVVDGRDWLPTQMCSVDERGAEKLMRDRTVAQLLESANERMCRVYPKATRVNSENFEAKTVAELLLRRFQMVALNVQTNDEAMQYVSALFLQNGGCGYLLAPPLSPEGAGIALKVQLFRALHIPKPGEGRLEEKPPLWHNVVQRLDTRPELASAGPVGDFYVTAQLLGPGFCCATHEPVGNGGDHLLALQSHVWRSSTVVGNGFNAEWEWDSHDDANVQVAYVLASQPQLTVLRFAVYVTSSHQRLAYQANSDAGPSTHPGLPSVAGDVCVAYSTVPLNALLGGLRALPLCHPRGEPINLASLLIRVQNHQCEVPTLAAPQPAAKPVGSPHAGCSVSSLANVISWTKRLRSLASRCNINTPVASEKEKERSMQSVNDGAESNV